MAMTPGGEQSLLDFPLPPPEREKNPLLQRILGDPLQFMSEPDLSGVAERHIRQTREYFFSPDKDRLTYSVCTAVFEKDRDAISSHLIEWGEPDGEFRCFPFVYSVAPSKHEVRSIDKVASELLTFWNDNSGILFGERSKVVNPVLAEQNGRMSILDNKNVGDFFLYRCSTPTPPALCRSKDRTPRKYRGYFIVAYDILGGAFYTINSRIKCYTNEHSFIEIIDPEVQPPDIHRIVKPSKRKRVNALLVLDYHIGDSLSLISVHARYLSTLPHINLSIDISRCRFLAGAKRSLKKAFFPDDRVKIISEIPDYRGYDLVFDPYDLIPGQFSKKPQNDSCAFSILSGLELGYARARHLRRDILDIHMMALKYWGVVAQRTVRPKFVEYRFPDHDERLKRIGDCRRKLLKGISGERNIILFFPFGLTEDRHYPPSRMRAVVEHFYNRGAVMVFAGSEVDTSRIYESTVNHSEAVSRGRIKKLAGKRFDEIVSAIIASDVVVSMDTGPLHLARALRVYPIGLYTKKVLNKEEFLRFPWYVDDGTVLQLRPDSGDHHVSATDLIAAIEGHLKSMFQETESPMDRT
jgi:hypothetical protein